MKKRRTSRVLSLALAVSLVLSLACLPASAEGFVGKDDTFNFEIDNVDLDFGSHQLPLETQRDNYGRTEGYLGTASFIMTNHDTDMSGLPNFGGEKTLFSNTTLSSADGKELDVQAQLVPQGDWQGHPSGVWFGTSRQFDIELYYLKKAELTAENCGVYSGTAAFQVQGYGDGTPVLFHITVELLPGPGMELPEPEPEQPGTSADPVYDVSLSATSIDLGSYPVSETDLNVTPQLLTVTNTGNRPVYWFYQHAMGNGVRYKFLGGDSLLEPGESKQLEVSWDNSFGMRGPGVYERSIKLYFTYEDDIDYTWNAGLDDPSDSAELVLEVPVRIELTVGQVELTASTSYLDFGSIVEGAYSPSKPVTVTNNSGVTLKLYSEESEYFNANSGVWLYSGESVTIEVWPERDLEPGEYTETLTLYAGPGGDYSGADAAISFQVHITVERDNQWDKYLSISPTSLDFGSDGSAAKTVTITNNADGFIELYPVTSDHFTVSAYGDRTLAAGQSTTFTVQPRAGLAAGTYSENIFLDSSVGFFNLPVRYTSTGEGQPAPTFTDVSPDAWYYDFVETVAEKKLFAGNGDGTFAPEANMTYAEFLAVLFQFSGDTLPTNSGPNWYDNHIQWAKDHDLIPAGMLNGFDPEAAITRQDMAALFGSFLSNYDYTAAPVNSGTPSFSDEGSIADYARDGVTLCCQLGIMGGNDDGTFAPGNTAIRAEVAVTMVQMARVMGR